MIVKKDFHFDAAHQLTNYYGKCEALHGHRYGLSVSVKGSKNPETGMVIDFCKLKEIVTNSVLTKLDHSFLNDYIENPSAENIAEWIFDRLSPILKTETCFLWKITVSETPTSHVEITKEDYERHTK